MIKAAPDLPAQPSAAYRAPVLAAGAQRPYADTMPTLSFRFAATDDISAVHALIERAYRSPDNSGAWDSESHLLRGPRTSPEEIAALIADPDSRFLLAETDDCLAGCCLLQRRPASGATPASAYFGMFAINPAARLGGLGRLVLAEAEATAARVWNASTLVMTVISVREPLIAWYERRGYARTGARLPFPFSETTGETTRDFDLVELRKALR